jgi:hypothetical protein
VIPAVLGFISLIAGLFLWQRKQKLSDTKEELETEKLRLEVKRLSPEQIAVKLIQEAASESENKPNEATDTKGQIKVINEYVRMEEIVFSKLSYCFGPHNVRTNLQIKDSAADVVVRINRSDTAIIEIKYYRRFTELSRRIREVREVLVHSVRSYNNVMPYHKTYGVGLIILGDDASNSAEKLNKVTSTNVNGIHIKVITIVESEFTRLDCSELKSLISNVAEFK